MTYTVKAGDTLRTIAARLLGDPAKWTVLWALNKATLKSKDQNVIYVGEVIEIPDTAKTTQNAGRTSTKKKGLPEDVKDDDVSLLVNGVMYSGWEEVNIKRSIEAASGSFTVTHTDLWPGQTVQWPIFVGDSVQVYIGEDLQITGWVDVAEISIDATSHVMTISGRDKTADIIDCSAINRPGEWRGKKIEAIAKELCAPYGVSVRADTDTGAALDTFRTQPGETVYEALERATKKTNVMMTSEEEGTLVFFRSGSERFGVVLKEGENLKSCTASFSNKERFKKYIVEAQLAGEGEDKKAVYATASDAGIARSRILSIVAEDQETQSQAQDRAKYEAQTRAAKAATFTAVVQGWRVKNVGVWKTNRIVEIQAPSCRAQGDVLIDSVEFVRGASGTLTTLTLKRPDAFKKLASATVPSTKTEAGWALE